MQSHLWKAPWKKGATLYFLFTNENEPLAEIIFLKGIDCSNLRSSQWKLAGVSSLGAPLHFGRSVNTFLIMEGGGGRLCPRKNKGTAGFSDLPTGLLLVNVVLLRLFNFRLSTSSSRTSMHQTLLVKWMEGKREKKNNPPFPYSLRIVDEWFDVECRWGRWGGCCGKGWWNLFRLLVHRRGHRIFSWVIPAAFIPTTTRKYIFY